MGSAHADDRQVNIETACHLTEQHGRAGRILDRLPAPMREGGGDSAYAKGVSHRTLTYQGPTGLSSHREGGGDYAYAFPWQRNPAVAGSLVRRLRTDQIGQPTLHRKTVNGSVIEVAGFGARRGSGQCIEALFVDTSYKVSTGQSQAALKHPWSR
jgi:hypothetical protein